MCNLLKKVDYIFIKVQEFIVSITGILVCLLIVAAAAARYIFKVDFYGSEEYIMYSAFWLYFIGSSLAARDNSHINADMVSAFVKNTRIKNGLGILRDVISLIVSCITTVWSAQYIARSIALSPVTSVLKTPLVYMQLPILISFVLMDIYILYYLIKSISAFRLNKEENA